MSDTQELHEVIRRNVKVLMALRGIDSNRALARMIGQNENHLTNRLAGRRKWQLEDLALLAEVFGVGPGDLLGDTASIVGATGPIRSAGGGATTQAPTRQYVAREQPALTAVPPLGAAPVAAAPMIDYSGAANRVVATDAA